MYLAVRDDNREELETVLSLPGCIPMNDGFDEPERMEFAETAALCVYYRGAYEGTGAAIQALTEYVRENSVQVTGPFHLPGGSAQLWGKQRGLYYAGPLCPLRLCR